MLMNSLRSKSAAKGSAPGQGRPPCSGAQPLRGGAKGLHGDPSR